jgi:hypothetical protein
MVQDAATDWIAAPKFDARLAVQIARKIGIEKGDLVASLSGAGA